MDEDGAATPPPNDSPPAPAPRSRPRRRSASRTPAGRSDDAAARRSRAADADDDEDVARSCRSCREPLSCIRDRVELLPCRCVVCPKCLLDAYSRRATSKEVVVCRECKVAVEGHEYVKALDEDYGDDVGYELLERQKALLEEKVERLRVCIELKRAAYAPLSDDEEEDVEDGNEDGEYKPGRQYKPGWLNCPPRKKQRYGAEHRCIERGCGNMARAGGKCTKHGGKSLPVYCRQEGCTNLGPLRGYCIKHGAEHGLTVPKCSHPGCTHNVVNNKLCIRHGARRRYCKYEGCTNAAQV
ncbi:hypothetical protein ACHAWF_006830 [Thalassiosira exigua]